MAACPMAACCMAAWLYAGPVAVYNLHVSMDICMSLWRSSALLYTTSAHEYVLQVRLCAHYCCWACSKLLSCPFAAFVLAVAAAVANAAVDAAVANAAAAAAVAVAAAAAAAAAAVAAVAGAVAPVAGAAASAAVAVRCAVGL